MVIDDASQAGEEPDVVPAPGAAEVDCVFLIGPRACGKTTVARELGCQLAGWRVIDLDLEFRRQRVGPESTHFSISPEQYYEGSREILLEQLPHGHLIVALGGGTLINARTAPEGCYDTVFRCHARGKLVLLLPSRFDFRNRRILARREEERNYGMDWERATRDYNSRIGFFRDHADLTLYGGSPEQNARRIIEAYGLCGWTG